MKRLIWSLGLIAAVASATDLTLQLPGNTMLSRKSVQYQCDAGGTRIGLPSGQFTVQYINGGGNSLAAVPILGNVLVFVNVTSGSGARYVAQQYTWWEAKGSVTVSSDSISGNVQSSCRPVH